MTNNNSISKDFSKAIRSALASKGIQIVSSTWLPAVGGDFANGERGYILVANDTQMIRSYLEVLEMAK